MMIKGVEWCSNCGREFNYTVDSDNYRIYHKCPHCGEWNSLCSLCDTDTCTTCKSCSQKLEELRNNKKEK